MSNISRSRSTMLGGWYI